MLNVSRQCVIFCRTEPQRQASTSYALNLLNSNISSTCPHNMVNFGRLAAEIGWRLWGTPANLNEFLVLSSLLHRRRSTEINQTLHSVRPSPRLVYYISGGLFSFWGFCHVQNSLCVQVLRSPVLTALLHGTRAVSMSQTLRRDARNGIKELSFP